MEERAVTCGDGSRWKVVAAVRLSAHRLQLVFESLDVAGEMLLGEASAGGVEELDDRQLCFLLDELRQSEGSG